jgi:hypothetical protein
MSRTSRRLLGFPSIGIRRDVNGFGGIIVNNCDVIVVPFDRPGDNTPSWATGTTRTTTVLDTN